MTFNRNRSGNIVSMVNGAVYRLRSDGKLAYAGSDTGAYITVTLTGWNYVTPNGNTMYQTTGGGWIDLMDGWESRGFESGYSARSAQSYVNEITRNNQRILENNLVCARFAHKLNKQEKKLLRELQTRLEARNASLMNDGLVTVEQTSYPQGYADLSQSLSNFMASSEGVGVVITTTAVIVISALVVTSLATAAYFAYRYMAAESKDDVKYSKELTRILTTKLTEEEYEKLRNETAGIVTKARLKQSLSDLGTAGKILLAGGLGFGIFYALKRLRNEQY